MTTVSEVLLYAPYTRPTGRTVGKALGLSFGTLAFFQRKGRPISRIVLRWGGVEGDRYEDRRTLNKSAAIRTASSKVHSLRRFREAGVPVPRFTTDPNEARQWGTVVFGRTSQGFGGRGITVYQPGTNPGHHELFTEFIPNEREYRLHVCGGLVISIQRKYLERPNLDDHGYIKNHQHGYVFQTPQKELNKSRQEAAIAAVEALGLDFGAVDLVVDRDNKEYVLEVNTAPALSPLRLQHYAEALRKVLRGIN
jgi:glutathione synthase/RimK-type ligase-like ATP-grasp enzyme